jgi:subtilase family serine protease
MRVRKILSSLAAAAITLGMATTPMFGADHSKTSSYTIKGQTHPAATLGAFAEPAAVANPEYGLFTCQVGLGTNGSVCYDPYQVRKAYGIDKLISAGYTGKGKTIVIVDAYQSPNMVAQLNTYDTFYGLPSLNGLGGAFNAALGTFTQVAPDGLTPFVTGNSNMTGWAEEISLDVLWAHAIAPGANITLVLAKSNNDSDILSATRYAVDNNLGDIISQSFGENETCIDPDTLAQQHEIFADAARKNITVLASSGDQGSAQQTCDGNSWMKVVSSPAVDPLVTGVGGTELHAAKYCFVSLGCDPATNPTFGTYQGEVVWNELFGGNSTEATGGGFSLVFDEPAYQQGTIHGGKARGVPDVAYNAAIGHGVLTYLNIPGIPPGYYSFGGTSAGSPQWAALVAIADQKAGGSLGFINSALYKISHDSTSYAANFHDITSGNNAALELDSNNHVVSIPGYAATAGWDPTTGLGSPIADSLVDALINQVSVDDGIAAIANSKPHAQRNPHNNTNSVHPH